MPVVAYMYSAVLNTVLTTLNSKTTISVETYKEINETTAKRILELETAKDIRRPWITQTTNKPTQRIYRE